MSEFSSQNQPSSPENLQNAKFTVESYTGNDAIWEKYGNTLLDIHRQVTNNQYSPELQKAQFSRIENYVSDSDTQVFFLKDSVSQAIVGFTYVHPTDIEPEYFSFAQQEQQRQQLSTDQYIDIQRRTAEVGWTEILDEYRHQGGWSLLMNNLDLYLKNNSLYDTQVRIVTQTDNYSKAVAQRYKHNIIYRSAFTEDYGPQEYFRINIPHSDNSS